MTIPRRGLREITTRSGRADHAVPPYMVYMKVTCLEMEKLRRNSEKQSARRRIADIDARLAEIEAEKESLLQSAGEGSNGSLIAARGLQPNGAADSGNGGFKMRY